MSVFGRILEKLGLHKHEGAAAANAPGATNVQAGRPSSTASQGQAGGSAAPHQASPAAPQRQAGPATAPAGSAGAATPGAARTPSSQPQPQPMSEVDVTARLEQLAAQNPQKLNWRTSIVDLMKLLGMESSLAERKELAQELGYPSDQMSDTARMNTWLHQQVLHKIAENGGKVPKELLN
jgi:hypothetical protein